MNNMALFLFSKITPDLCQVESTPHRVLQGPSDSPAGPPLLSASLPGCSLPPFVARTLTPSTLPKLSPSHTQALVCAVSFTRKAFAALYLPQKLHSLFKAQLKCLFLRGAFPKWPRSLSQQVFAVGLPVPGVNGTEINSESDTWRRTERSFGNQKV